MKSSQGLYQSEKKSKNEGRIVLFVALLMFGGAIFMFGKSWYDKHQKSLSSVTEGPSLANLRFISTENILDRIKK
ncbi:MAG: hypothetical protein WAT81_00495, partial [Candidatus Moraniibacteriota bacterium]